MDARKILGLGAMLLLGCVPGSVSAPSVDAAGQVGGGDLLAPPLGRPGQVAPHRLNRAEYNNTIRDLTGLNLQLAAAFPIDTFGDGFDNNADVLSMSPLLLEKYVEAAEALVRAVLADASSRGSIYICSPGNAPAACARTILTQFAGRAYRRPASADEVAALVAVYTQAQSAGDSFEASVALALQAALVSPNFLFRIETSGGKPGEQAPLGGYELASRLSYFLWSSMPDAPLLAAAGQGNLNAPAAVQAQVQRMLQDGRAGAFVDNFVGQWLLTRGLADVQPDASLFPSFSEPLRAAMAEESRAFFSEMLTGAHAVPELLSADFTFANATLAQHYQLPGAAALGSAHTRVAVGTSLRGGILSQGAVLMVTSHPDRTSPTKRGKFVLTQLLCSPPPPPPPQVGAFERTPTTATSLRDQLEAHRASPACTTCHRMMDPLGFGLENFDAIGAYRTQDGGVPIDASGVFTDGTAFDGVAEEIRIVSNDARFVPCLVRKIATYATGRGMVEGDAPALAEIERQLAAQNGRLSALLELVATSPLMTTRQGELP